jgi:diguanylate cyclase (GGDEF)-like protein
MHFQKIKKLNMLNNILLSDIKIDASHPYYRKLILTNLAYILSLAVFISFFLANLATQYNYTKLIEIIFVLPILYGFVKLRQDKDIKSSALFLTYIIFFALLTSVFLAKFQDGILYWTLLFPLLAIHLCDIKKGLLLVVIFYLIVYMGAFYYNFSPTESVSTLNLTRLVVTSMIISSLVYFYEESITNSFRVQNQLNFALTNSIKEAKVLAITDALTGLYNKRHFDAVAEEEFNRAKRAKSLFTLAILDIDNFKPYNDTYGHTAGDEVLKKIGKILKQQTSRSGDYAFRVGGEEFAIILQSASSEGTHNHFNNLKELIESQNIIHKNNKPYNHITASIGAVQLIDYKALTLKEAYNIADQNLYYVKRNGRNNIKLNVV